MYLKRRSIGPLFDQETEALLALFKNKTTYLPGFSKGDRADFDYHIHHNLTVATFDGQKNRDSSTIYHYEFARASSQSRWKLQKAWRKDQNGRVIEEYPVH